MKNQDEVLIRMATDLWNGQVARTTKLLNEFSDEQLEQEIAPSKNSGTYLLGHLTAVHDNMIQLLGLGERLHPELEEVFIKNPDKSSLPKPSVKQLRTSWEEVNTKLSSKLSALTIDQWFDRHTSVSPEDFAKEPHRNRLNVVIGRATHLNYHLGQMMLLRK